MPHSPEAPRKLLPATAPARLIIFLASAPGVGKTHRLLEEARRLRQAGVDALIGAAGLKERPDLGRKAAGLPALPLREGVFDFEAALARKPAVLILDELENNGRWQQALKLREHGITILGACNIAHLETLAASAELLIGAPVNERIPMSFLQSADEVIALDASPQLLQMRLRSGKIAATFQIETLEMLRQLLLRTIDSLTKPGGAAEQASTALAILAPDVEPMPFLRRTSAVASALDLALEIVAPASADLTLLSRIAGELQADVRPEPFDAAKADLATVRASLISIPAGGLAAKLASRRLDRDLFIVGRGQTFIGDAPIVSHPYGLTAGDRMRVGYGRLTVYLGAAAGSGKTYAMLDRAQQLQAEGIDVVAGFVNTREDAEAAQVLRGLEALPHKRLTENGVVREELDREAILARKPKVVLIDDLAHTNATGAGAAKRYEDVLAVLRAGIDVIATLNVQHLEALSDAVFRVTGNVVRETLPDGILALADEVILVDVAPDIVQHRSTEQTERLLALRELALREALRVRNRRKLPAPFERLVLSVASRVQDIGLIKRCSRIATRLEVEFAVAFVTEPNSQDIALEGALREAARNERAQWLREEDPNVPQAVLRVARAAPETTIAVAGTLRTPGFMQRKTFARQLLDAGALELLILAPRPPREGAPDFPGELR